MSNEKPAATAPGTATREETRDVGEHSLDVLANLIAMATVAGDSEVTPYDIGAALGAVRDYEKRLREENEAIVADLRENNRLATRATEEATARVERLTGVLEEIRAMTALGLPGSIYADIYKMAKAALGVPTSAADADGGSHDGT